VPVLRFQDLNKKMSDIDELDQSTKIKQSSQDSEFGLLKKQLIKKLSIKHAERKLIVSSIPLDTSDQEIYTLFHTALKSLRPGSDPISSCTISDDKTHATLEFKSKEDREDCLLLDGIELRNRRLKISKHMSYMHQRILEMKKELREKERREKETEIILSTNIFPNHDNRIFMGNLPVNMPEEDVRRMVESFGRLKSFSLVKSSAAGVQSRGFCFFEYWDPKVTDRAIEQLNLLEIGDKRVKVQRANQGKSNVPALPAPQKSHGKKFSEPLFRGGPSGILASLDTLQLQQIQAALSVPVHALTPSRCIMLLNIASAQDLVDDGDYDEIYTDIWQECNRYGAVESLIIPRPDLNTYEVGHNVGKIYVKYFDVTSAKKAKYNIAGKTFNKRTVVVSFYPELWFNNGDLI
jgi:splicing factor U2AF subunit